MVKFLSLLLGIYETIRVQGQMNLCVVQASSTTEHVLDVKLPNCIHLAWDWLDEGHIS